MLKTYVMTNRGQCDFAFISQRVGKTEVECIHRWEKHLNPDVPKPKKRRPWSKDEDAMVKSLVEKHGPSKWTFIAEHLPGRIGK